MDKPTLGKHVWDDQSAIETGLGMSDARHVTGGQRASEFALGWQDGAWTVPGRCLDGELHVLPGERSVDLAVGDWKIPAGAGLTRQVNAVRFASN
mgnify:CR=1 FL=1